MKKIINNLIWGSGNRTNGLIAFAIVGFIALGCACPRNNDQSSTGNTSSENPFDSTNQSDTTASRPGETKPDASKGTLPAEGELQYLVRETMLDFNNAIQTADFNAFYSKISKQWQEQITPEQMETQFQPFITGQASFGEIEDMTAQIKSKGTRKQSRQNFLDVKGEYPTSPIPTTFDLSYISEDGDWRLFKIQVYTGVRKR